MTAIRHATTNFLGLAVLLAASAVARAQQWDGIPSAGLGDQLVPEAYAPLPPEANEINDYVDWSPLDGLFFKYDRIFFLMTPPRATTVGDPNTTYFVTNNTGGLVSISATLDTSWIDPNGDWGDRFEFGWSGDTFGWSVGIMNANQRESLVLNSATVVFADPQNILVSFQDADQNNIDDDLDHDGIYGSSGQDTSVPLDGTIDQPAPADFGDLIVNLPEFTRLEQTATTTLTGVEAMGTFSRSGFFDIGVLDVFGGARYLRVRDNYHVEATGSVLGNSYWDANVDNHLIGPQIGARWWDRYGFATLSGELRGMAAYNQQHSRLLGEIANDPTVIRPAHLFATSFNSAFERDEFSPLTEWRAELLLELIEGLSMRFAYTGMYIGGISRAAPKVDYTLPTLGLNARESDTGFFANGFSLGLQLNF